MTVREAEKTPTKSQTKHEPSEMQKMAQRVERHHTMPMPDAKSPQPHPFPPIVITTLWLGIIGGGLLGLFLGVLLQSNTLVIPRLEGLYAMSPFTFQFFWLMAGIGLGIVGAAVATLLIPPPDYQKKGVEPQPPPENVIEVDLDQAGE